VFEPTHQVFNVQGVTAIPLELERARTVVNTLASKNAVLARPSLLSGITLDTLPDTLPLSSPEGESVESPVSATRVHFASVDQVKVMTPNLDHSFQIKGLAPPRPHSPAPSEASSTATSDYSNEATSPVQPIAKALANKLSFWSSRLSKRGALFPSTPDLTTSFDKEKEEELDRMVREEQGVPAEVLDGLLETTAPAPATSEAKHNEMEDRIVKECIREFTKGGMYFAYNFGAIYPSICPLVADICVAQILLGHCSTSKIRRPSRRSNLLC
jgi:phosphatidylinositol 4-phosphatase